MYSDVLKSIADLLRFMRWPCGWLAAKVANQIIDSPIIEIMSSFAYIWIFFIFQRINSPKKIFQQNFFRLLSEWNGRGPASHDTCSAYLCVTWTHITCGYRQVMRVPARVTLPNRRRNNNRLVLHKKKCLKKKKLKKLMTMIIVDLFPRDFYL